MKICITAGGTGGHIFPALALASELSDRQHDIIYIGHRDQMEATLVKAASYPFYGLSNKGLSGSVFKKIKALYSQFGAIKEAKQILKKEKVDMVVSFGGYVTFPVCEASKQLGIPFILHEQNAFAGKANKAIEKHAAAIVICYEHARQYFKNPNTILLGNPRASMVKDQQLNEHILKEYGLSNDKPIVYFVMGSLGSETVNTLIAQMINEIDISGIDIVISSGTRNYHIYENLLKKEVAVFQHIDQVSLLPHCSLVVSRAGATSIAEIMAFGVPSILVPSPYVANNHQYFNAKACVDQGAALMLEEKDLSIESLSQMIKNTLHNPELLASLKQNTALLANTDANDKIADLVEELL